MHEVGGPSRGDRLGRDDSEVHSAIRFAVVAAVVGVGLVGEFVDEGVFGGG